MLAISLTGQVTEEGPGWRAVAWTVKRAVAPAGRRQQSISPLQIRSLIPESSSPDSGIGITASPRAFTILQHFSPDTGIATVLWQNSHTLTGLLKAVWAKIQDTLLEK